MKKIILLSGLILANFVWAHAQRFPQATPTPIVEDARRQQGLDRQDDIDSRSRELRNAEAFPVKNEKEAKIFQENIRPLYREPGKEELKLLEPGSEDVEKFNDFLRQKNTGLIKLIADKGCEGSNTNVVSSAPECLKYAIPGYGSSYSFRINNYRIQRLADLNYTGKSFRAFGVLTHGIFVNLGDIPLEKVDLQADGINFLLKLEPASDLGKAQELADQLLKGIKNDKFVYRSILPVQENTTYVLRSIAYRSKVYLTLGGVTYDEFAFDKRKETVVAFRLVRRDADGSATIVWKELASRKSPELKFEQNKQD